MHIPTFVFIFILFLKNILLLLLFPKHVINNLGCYRYDVGLGMRLPRKAREKIRTLHVF